MLEQLLPSVCNFRKGACQAYSGPGHFPLQQHRGHCRDATEQRQVSSAHLTSKLVFVEMLHAADRVKAQVLSTIHDTLPRTCSTI